MRCQTRNTMRAVGRPLRWSLFGPMRRCQAALLRATLAFQTLRGARIATEGHCWRPRSRGHALDGHLRQTSRASIDGIAPMAMTRRRGLCLRQSASCPRRSGQLTHRRGASSRCAWRAGDNGQRRSGQVGLDFDDLTADATPIAVGMDLSGGRSLARCASTWTTARVPAGVEVKVVGALGNLERVRLRRFSLLLCLGEAF